MGLRWDFWYHLLAKSDADGGDVRCSAKAVERLVVITFAIANPIAFAVKAQNRHEEDSRGGYG